MDSGSSICFGGSVVAAAYGRPSERNLRRELERHGRSGEQAAA